jgi:hypothetical protein
MTALSGSTPAQLLAELAATRGGDGEAEQIRCEGTRVIPGRSDAGPDVSFGEGDIIVLVTPERNSFKGVWQGNKRDVNSTGDRAKIDSITDLRELATSPKVSASLGGDGLTLHITQTAGVLDIALEGLGQEDRRTCDFPPS